MGGRKKRTYARNSFKERTVFDSQFSVVGRRVKKRGVS
jgi:hypothetical protein